MEHCTNANLSMFPLADVFFYSVEFKEIVWSDGRRTVQNFVDHSEFVD